MKDDIDLVEALSEHLDGTYVQGLGFIAQAGVLDDGLMILEIRADSGEDQAFVLRVEDE